VVAEALAADAREAAKASRTARFAGMQFDAFSPQLNLTDLSQTGRREFRHILSSSDQQLIGLRVDVGPKGFGPGADIDRLLSQFDRVMEAAKGLAAPLICVEAGPLPEPATPEKPRPKVSPQDAGLIIIPETAAATPQTTTRPPPDPGVVAHVDSALVELGAHADRMGVMLALRSELASFAAIERALTSAACPWFGVDLDPVAILHDEWESDQVFSRLGSLIRHVRGRDAAAGSDRRTRAAVIGKGSVAWGEFLAALDSAGYNGWLTIDSLELPDRAGAAIAGAEFLRKFST
jgi:sugar phosphate isomerase/epimerase